MKECPACRRCFPDDVAHCPQDGDATTPSLHGEPILDARYQLEKRLGQGGMGVVFRARHIFLKTAHAIKVILPDLVGNDPMLVTRFRQEALAAAAIRHQNIIAVTDFGVVRGTMPFLVMEFVNGRSLQDILAEEKVMSPARALEFISAMGAGVAAAHRQNIVHRDLKPLNVMTQEKLPIAEGLKILDFGLAKIKSGELLGSFVQAKTSGLMGSPFYMAPEQWSDDEPDSRADIYSLGIILYQMLSGDVPFKGSSIPSIMKKHLTLPPPSFQSIGMNVPPNVEAVVRHALEKDADARTPTVEALVQEFRNAVNSGGPTVQVIRDTGTFDPNRTVLSPASTSTDPQIGEKTGHTEVAFDSMAGTISAGALGDEARKALAAEEYQRGQEARDKVARDELAREAEARRTYEDESTRKQRQEEERVRKDKEEQEARDRQQREQLDRVAKQARELEERLARLATSMPPPPGVIDPEATQLAHSVPPRAITDQSMASYAGASQHSIPRFGVEQKSKKGPLLLVVAAVLLVLLVGGGIAAYFIMQPGQSSANVNPTPSASPTTTTVPPSTDLVQIPGGTFQMGRNDGPPQEQPEHPVTVQPFLMDRTEVTNNEYSAFVADTNYQAPSHFVRGQPLPGQEQWPVVNVSPIDAQAFAAWRSKRDGVEYRLPTEEEWEYAARSGGEYKLFPWGNRFEEKRAVVKEASPRAVGSYSQGANRWGVLDLIGNVWEWTSSKASLYTRGSSAIPGGSKEWVVARGGSYSSDPDSPEIPVSSTYRDWYDPTSRHPNFGFRLVRSAQ